MSNNTYTWEFPALEVYKQVEDQTLVVYNVHWRYKAETGSYSTENYGVVGLQPYISGSSPFIPFEELTKDIVTGWVTASMGSGSVERMQASLDERINVLINPPTEVLPAPWNKPPEPTPTPTPPEPTPMPTMLPPPMPTQTPVE